MMKRYLSLAALTLTLSLLVSSCGVLQPYGGVQRGERVDQDPRGFQTLFVASSDAVYSYAFHPLEFSADHTATFDTPSPKQMVISERGDRLYIANSLRSDAMVTAVGSNLSSGELSLLNQSYVLGSEPAAIALQEDKVVTVNRGDGSLTLLRVASDGTLGQADWRIDLGDSKLSEPTSLSFSPDRKHLFVVDKGQNMIMHFRVHTTMPPLTIDASQITLDRGFKPIKMVFDISGRNAYLLGADGAKVYHYKHRNGELTLESKISMTGIGQLSGTDLVISPNGHWLYVAHKGGKIGVSTFAIDRQSGEPTYQRTQAIGKDPQNIVVSPTGRFIAIASTRANEVEVYHLNLEDGSAEGAPLSISVPSPSNIIWRNTSR